MLQAHVQSNYIERAELERLRAELEARSRLELNQKLEEVNQYLEQQAQARNHLDSMRENKEVDMKREFEKNKKDLLVRYFVYLPLGVLS